MKTVRAGPWFERATAKDIGTRGVNGLRNLGQDFLTLNRTRPGYHRKMPATDLHHWPVVPCLHLNHGVPRVHLAAGKFEWLQNGQNLLHARHRLQWLGLQLLLIAYHADDGSLFTVATVGAQPKFLDATQNVVNLLRGGRGFKNNNHGRFQSEPAGWAG